jgi:regulator of sigma E protease
MITFIATIIVISVLVFVHEFGHFAMAKLGGVRVEKFSIGFPPTLFKRKIGETIYAIGAIPFGGYVKLAGENSEKDGGEPKPHDLNAKPIWIRASIMAAGPFMNIVFALFLFWVVLAFHGIGEVSGEPIVGGVVIDSPADSAGIIALDRMISLDGEPIDSWGDMADYVHARAGETLDFGIVREDSEFVLAVVPVMHEVSTETGLASIGLVGIQPNIEFVAAGILAAVPGSFTMMWEILAMMGDFIGRLFSTGIQKGDIGGPLLIAKMAGMSAQAGWASFLFFMAALSINLGLMNLLPFPVLDGGQLAFLAVEAIRRKPLSLKVRLAIQQVGMILILALMVYVTFNDVSLIFGN